MPWHHKRWPSSWRISYSCQESPKVCFLVYIKRSCWVSRVKHGNSIPRIVATICWSKRKFIAIKSTQHHSEFRIPQSQQMRENKVRNKSQSHQFDWKNEQTHQDSSHGVYHIWYHLVNSQNIPKSTALSWNQWTAKKLYCNTQKLWLWHISTTLNARHPSMTGGLRLSEMPMSQVHLRTSSGLVGFPGITPLHRIDHRSTAWKNMSPGNDFGACSQWMFLTRYPLHFCTFRLKDIVGHRPSFGPTPSVNKHENEQVSLHVWVGIPLLCGYPIPLHTYQVEDVFSWFTLILCPLLDPTSRRFMTWRLTCVNTICVFFAKHVYS